MALAAIALAATTLAVIALTASRSFPQFLCMLMPCQPEMGTKATAAKAEEDLP